MVGQHTYNRLGRGHRDHFLLACPGHVAFIKKYFETNSVFRRPHLPARPPMAQIDSAIKDIRIVSGRGLTQPLTPASGVR